MRSLPALLLALALLALAPPAQALDAGTPGRVAEAAASLAAERLTCALDADLCGGWACVPASVACAPPLPAAEWGCFPEDPPCHPGRVLCPMLGGMAGWCVRAGAGRDGAEASAMVGHAHGPRFDAGAEASWGRQPGGSAWWSAACPAMPPLLAAMVAAPWPGACNEDLALPQEP
jgi:hypothetical protein